MTQESLIPIEKILNAAPVTGVFELLEQVARQLHAIQRQTVSEANLTPPNIKPCVCCGPRMARR